MTDIEWTDRVWNPIVGCSRVSPGCEHCYAERHAHRKLHESHRGLTVLRKHGPAWTGEVRFLPERLADPFKWRKACRVFVNSMSDVWHEQVTNEQIGALFGAMAATPHITYQVVTKRPERMRAWFKWAARAGRRGAPNDDPWWIVFECALLYSQLRLDAPITPEAIRDRRWPLDNVGLLVTCEDQQRADERIPLLLDTPAAWRGVSYEPALGPVHFNRPGAAWLSRDVSEDRPAIDWLIIGGESGPQARPFDLAWARSAVAEARAAGVPVFMKQLGARPCDGEPRFITKHRKGGDPTEWPAELRIREFP